VYYNSDDAIVKNFPDWPYRDNVKKYFPPDRETMTRFLEAMKLTKKKDFGEKYHIYERDHDNYLPVIYVAKKADFSLTSEDYEYFDGGWVVNSMFFQESPGYEQRTAFLLKETEHVFSNYKPKASIPTISFKKINPTQYMVSVQNATDPYILTFLEPFNAHWKVFVSSEQLKEPVATSYYNDEISELKTENVWLNSQMFDTWNKEPIADKTHVQANGYANAWYIRPSDIENKNDYTLVIEYTPQRVFYNSLAISLLGLIACAVWVAMILWKSTQLRRFLKLL